MKKILPMIVSVIMVCTMVACSASNDASETVDESTVSADTEASSDSSGETFFTDTITITVPFNAGSNTDSQIRFIQPYLEQHLGVSTIVVNSGGASGTIGTTEFITEDADGYNILFSLPTPTVYKVADGSVTYTEDDLIPVSQVTADPFYMAVSAENEDFTDGASLIEYIKNNPGEFTYANAGNGGIAHLAFAVFLQGEGLDALSVPFTGGTADCYTAVMGGHVMGHSVSEADLIGRSDYNVLINLGTKSDTPGFEDIPTLAELGYDGYVTDTFAGFYYMAGVDQAAVDAFDKAVEDTLNDPEFQQAASEANFSYSYMNSADLKTKIDDTIVAITPVLESLS